MIAPITNKEERKALLQKIKPILDEARALHPTFEGDNHIWKALDNVHVIDKEKRLQYFRLIKDELRREEKERKTEAEARRELMIQDAAKAEFHHRKTLGKDY